MRNEVGARRSVKAISANPMATVDDLVWLREKDPVAAVHHPNCPPEMWWELAADYPIEAMSSALYWMLTLESPERWEQLQRKNIDDWVDAASQRLPFLEMHLFAADCAEHVLHLYEREFPGDTRVRDTIEARRRYANGQISQAEWEVARQSAYATAHAAWTAADFTDVSVAYAADAAHTAHAANSAAYAGSAAALAADSGVPTSSAWHAARHSEYLWQWERVQQYLRGEVQ